MKQCKHPGDFDSRVCNVLIDIKKSRSQFVANIPANIAERTDSVLAAAFQSSMNHDLMHIAKCIFISGLSEEIREKSKIIKRLCVLFKQLNHLVLQHHLLF